MAEPERRSRRPPTASGLFIVGMRRGSRRRDDRRCMSGRSQAPRPRPAMRLSSRARNPATGWAPRLMRALRERTGGRVRFAGVGGREMAAEGLASLFPIDDLAIIGFARDPAPAAARSCAAFATPPMRWWRPGPTRWSSSTARISPTGWRGACAPPRPRSRSSTMCRPRSGLGGPAARAPCAAMSTTCWRCCRSSRRRIERLGGPPCTYVGHPLAASSSRAAAERRGGATAGSPSRRSCWCCRAAGAARSSGCWRSSADALALLQPSAHRAARDRAAHACRTCASGSAPRRRTGRCGHASWSSRGEAGGVPHRPGGARQVRHRDARARARRRPDGRRLPGLVDRGDRGRGSPIQVPSVDPRQPGPGGERGAGIPAARCTPENLAAALVPLLRESPQRRRQIEAFARLDAIMRIDRAGTARSRRRGRRTRASARPNRARAWPRRGIADGQPVERPGEPHYFRREIGV